MRSLLLDGYIRSPPPPVQISAHSNRKQLSNGILIGVIVLFGLSCILFRAFYKRYDTRRRSRSPNQSDSGFIDVNRGGGFDDSVWHIRSVGLQQSLIDSIAVFTYKSGEGPIVGTDCSVCLNEFQEEESLRLLPKCSHAFHLPCIDTWLRSHKNCPLCRAPIVNGVLVAQVELSLSSSNNFTSIGASVREQSSDADVGNETSDARAGDATRLSSMAAEATVCNEIGSSKVPSEYSSSWDHVIPSSEFSEDQSSTETETRALRRSVSLDSSSAQEFYDAVAESFSGSHQPKASPGKGGEKNRITASLSFRKLIGSSSIGHSQQIGTCNENIVSKK